MQDGDSQKASGDPSPEASQNAQAMGYPQRKACPVLPIDVHKHTHNYRPILGIDTFKCIFLWSFMTFYPSLTFESFFEASTAASCSEHVDASKKVPQTTSHLLRAAGKSTAFCKIRKAGITGRLHSFNPKWPQGVSCCFCDQSSSIRFFRKSTKA